MGRLAFILRHRLPVIIFVIAAVIGGVLIFWYISNKEGEISSQEISETQENISDTEDEDIEISGENISSGHYGQLLSSSIPYGLRAVSLPISFFGDVSAISGGDRVDIISVFYDPGSNELHSEIILGQKEIIIIDSNENTLDPENYQDATSSGYLSDGILSSVSSGKNNNSQLKKILVITFYLEVTEVERTFKAIEGGQLYLSLCPAGSEEYRY
jgi:hypothetical protein